MTGKNPIENALLPGVEAGELAGAAALVWRDGRDPSDRDGRDVATSSPGALERNTIFRIASMAKR